MDIEENSKADRNIKEFNISVPWGHLAVKTWGNKEDPHVIVIHGRMDNAGSFDNLIPLLPPTFYYICVDLPGHGQSSSFPPHLPLHSIDFVIVLKLLVAYFKKEKYIFLCHSYGAVLAFLFTRLYPEYVAKLILLDIIHFYPIGTNKAIDYLRAKMDAMIEIEQKSVTRQVPTYTYEEALQKLCSNRYEGEKLTRKAAEPLLKKSLIQHSDGKYSFSTDQRMKAYLDPIHDSQYIIQSLKNDPIFVPILVIFAKLNEKSRRRYAKLLAYLQSRTNVKVVYVDGHHDVHNNHPERVAGYVNIFLLQKKAKL